MRLKNTGMQVYFIVSAIKLLLLIDNGTKLQIAQKDKCSKVTEDFNGY